MNTVKLYASVVVDLSFLLFATLADLDQDIRIIAGLVGIILAVLTGIKFTQDIRLKRIETRLKQIELEKREEEFRRFMEKRYTDK